MAEIDDLHAHLTALIPVLRDLNRAAERLAAALPGPSRPILSAEPLPSVNEALAEVEAAIDGYCSVSVEHSGLLG